MSDELIASPLHDRHVALGARFGPFAGWRMPIQFRGTLAEHEAVRSGVGVFDVSHLGTVWVLGTGALDAVAATFTNDPAVLSDGSSQYTLCCDDDGGIVDDLIVYRLAANEFVAVPNAANTDAVVRRLARSADSHGAGVEDRSREYAVLAVQGPASLETVAAALGADAAAVPYLEVRRTEVGGVAGLLARTGYTGEVGCELVVPAGGAAAVWDALVDAGAEPAGLGARDTLRLEMGYPLHGNELSRSTDPFEAGLGWAVKLDRGGFTGQEALRARRERGPSRRLRGLRTSSRRPPRAGMAVRRAGEPVGEVTSGSYSPTLGTGIGLAYLDVAVQPGDEVVIDVRGTELPAEVVAPPFVDRSPRG